MMLDRIRLGNERYVEFGAPVRAEQHDPRAVLARERQATVLACCDLRSNLHQLFGLAAGDLYVLQTPAASCSERDIRDAGLMGSRTASGLLIVLGHYPCGVIDFVVDREPKSRGAYWDEVRESAAMLPGDRPLPRRDLCCVHAQRTARVLSAGVAGERIDVEAAFLDEKTGRVEFRPLH